MAREFWVEGRTGTLSRKAQAQVWALTIMSEKLSFPLSQDTIASQVQKIGGGCPNQSAISKLQKAFRDDADWYPGKNIDEKEHGHQPKVFTGQMQQACANAAMALKREGYEPTVEAVVQRCSS